MKRRAVSIIMTGILAAGLFAGCSSDKGNTSSDNTDGTKDNQSSASSDTTDLSSGKGRYMEEELTFPVQEGEGPLGLFMQDGVLTLYTYMGDSVSGEGYYSYKYQDGAWSDRTEETGMNTMETEGNIQFDALVLGQDGNLYGLGAPVDTEQTAYGGRILKEDKSAGTWTDITPEPLTKVQDSGYSTMIPDFDVLSDGTLCIFNGDVSQVEGYRDGEKVFAADTTAMYSDRQEAVSAYGDTIAVIGKDQAGIDFYGGEDYASQGTVPLDTEMEGVMLAGSGDTIWYCLDRKGIQRFQESGDILETVLDGSYGKMSNADLSALSFVTGESDDFYALYKNYTLGSFAVCHYYFDENVSATADTVLTIYGLRENKTVQQAVSYFQSQHPEVKVDYTYAAGADEAVSTDQIRSMNAELLNGDGADVLILDGLSIDSYVDKGILADLSDITESLSSQGVLMDTIGNTASRDGKTYAIPARIGIPVAYGSTDACESLNSLESFNSYLSTNPDNRFFKFTFHDAAAKSLFCAMYPDLMQDGRVNQENLTSFITSWQQICTNLDVKSLEQKYEYETGQMDRPGLYFQTGSAGTADSDTVQIVEMQGLFSMMAPCYEMREAGLTPHTIRDYYVPYAIAGVNASTGQMDLAKEFVTDMFADEVQSSQTDDGLPVTENALNSLRDYVDTDTAQLMTIASSMVDPDTGEETMQSYGYPLSSEMQTYIDMIPTLKQPFVPDQVLLDTVKEEMENCYANGQTPEAAAQAVAQKMDTYLSE